MKKAVLVCYEVIIADIMMSYIKPFSQMLKLQLYMLYCCVTVPDRNVYAVDTD
jgi:hypothetical protein